MVPPVVTMTIFPMGVPLYIPPFLLQRGVLAPSRPLNDAETGAGTPLDSTNK
jgi:hypothetical protein